MCVPRNGDGASRHLRKVWHALQTIVYAISTLSTLVSQLDSLTFSYISAAVDSKRPRRVCAIPLGIVRREKGEHAGPVKWNQLQRQWLDIAEGEKKKNKKPAAPQNWNRNFSPKDDLLWLPNDCIMEIFRALGRMNLLWLFRCSALLSKSVRRLFETNKNIWVEVCASLGDIPLEYLHGGSPTLTDIEQGSFSKLISTRYLQQLHRSQGNLVVGPFGKVTMLEMTTQKRAEFAIHLSKEEASFQLDGGVILSRMDKKDPAQGAALVHFRRHFNGRTGQVLFTVPGVTIDDKFYNNLYLDASVSRQSEFASK